MEEPAEVEKEKEEEIIEENKSLVETEEEPQPPEEEVVEEAAPLIPTEDTMDLLVNCQLYHASFQFFPPVAPQVYCS